MSKKEPGSKSKRQKANTEREMMRDWCKTAKECYKWVSKIVIAGIIDFHKLFKGVSVSLSASE